MATNTDILPIAAVVMPADLTGAANGTLPDGVLVKRRFPGHSSSCRAHHLALRAFDAMAAGCRDGTGHELTVSGPADAYRTLDQQRNAFFDRYREVSHAEFKRAARTRRQFDGRFWVLKDPKAFALASPGSSNHGWGLAFDLAVLTQNGVEAVFGSGAWKWVRANTERFGFSWELQSEPHHVRLVEGDALSGAVREHEGATPIVRSVATTSVAPRPTLIVNAPPFTPFDLAVGVDDAHRVRWLQTILDERDWGEPAVSGVYDADTKDAVMVMQRALGVDVDGRYGRQTATALSGFFAQAVA